MNGLRASTLLPVGGILALLLLSGPALAEPHTLPVTAPLTSSFCPPCSWGRTWPARSRRLIYPNT